MLAPFGCAKLIQGQQHCISNQKPVLVEICLRSWWLRCQSPLWRLEVVHTGVNLEGMRTETRSAVLYKVPSRRCCHTFIAATAPQRTCRSHEITSFTFDDNELGGGLESLTPSIRSELFAFVSRLSNSDQISECEFFSGERHEPQGETRLT